MDNKLTKSDIKKILKMTFKYDPETVNTYLQNPQNADEEYRNTLIKLNMKKNPLEFIDKVYDTYNLHMEGGRWGGRAVAAFRGAKNRVGQGLIDAKRSAGRGYNRAKSAVGTGLTSGYQAAGKVRRELTGHAEYDRVYNACKNRQFSEYGDYRLPKYDGMTDQECKDDATAAARMRFGGNLTGLTVLNKAAVGVGRGAAAAVGMPTMATCAKCSKKWCKNDTSTYPNYPEQYQENPNQEDLQEHPDYQQGYYDALNEYPAGEEQYEEYPAGEEQYEEYPAGEEQMQQMPMQSPYVYPINYQQQYYE